MLKKDTPWTGAPSAHEFSAVSAVIGDKLFLYDDRLGCAFICCLYNQFFKVLRDLIYENSGHHLILIVLKNLRTDLVAIPVAHAQVVINSYLHVNLLHLSCLLGMSLGRL